MNSALHSLVFGRIAQWRIAGRKSLLRVRAYHLWKICLLFCVGFSAAVYAQPPAIPAYKEAGLPYIQNFSPEDFGGESQSWTILQDRRGVMYFGNYGVLEYDGVSWRRIAMPNKSTVRSLALDANGRIYVGAQGELGYLASDSLGQLQYVSLLDHVTPDNRDFADVWEAWATSHGIYFNTTKYLFRWQTNDLSSRETGIPNRRDSGSGGTLHLWQAETSFHAAFAVRDTIYVRQREVGLMKLTGDSLQLAPGGGRFADESIYVMLPLLERAGTGQGEDKKILIGTRTQGLFLYDGRTFELFKTKSDEFLLANQPYHGAVLPDCTFALATLRGGVAIIDQQGRLRQVINEEAGLRDETVHFAYPGPNGTGAVWLALNNGLARVETPSPQSLNADKLDIKGDVQAIVRHRGRLYAATGLGVHYLSPTSTAGASPIFKPVAGIASDCWSLLSTDRALLVATGDGVYRIEQDQAYQVCDLYSFFLYQSRYNRNVIFVGLQAGLAVLQKVDEQWRLAGRVQGVFEQVRTIVEEEPGVLWLGTGSQGAVRVKLADSDLSRVQEVLPEAVERYGPEHHVPAGFASVYFVKGRIVFATEKGLRRFDRESQSFVPDSTFGAAFADSTRLIGVIAEDRQGRVWISDDNSREIGPAVEQQDGAYTWHTVPFRRMVDFGNVFAIYPDAEHEEVMWFGSSNGLMRFDSNIAKDYAISYPALVRRVTVNGDSVIYGGASTEVYPELAEGLNMPTNNSPLAPTLAYANNALRFEYAAPSYDDPSKNHYQAFLEGFDDDWPDWSDETKKNYTNLPEGDYRLRVRAKNIYQHQSNEGVYAFTILRPWYRTWWAYAFYFGVFVALLYGSGKMRSRQLEKRNKELAKTVEERTQEIRKQNQQLEEKNAEILRTQEQLIMQEKMESIGHMTAGIAHEIKNPLNFVNNFAELSVELADDLDKELGKYRDNIEPDDHESIEEILADLRQNAAAIRDNGKRADSIVCRGHVPLYCTQCYQLAAQKGSAGSWTSTPWLKKTSTRPITAIAPDILPSMSIFESSSMIRCRR
ncbi:MAG: triple tyrosine motif-containing protein [Calditrichaeota bacterium]|nr:triple tyrosine motif-containing protein [Calditrichota bacterium]